jgi:hypothetical protein
VLREARRSNAKARFLTMTEKEGYRDNAPPQEIIDEAEELRETARVHEVKCAAVRAERPRLGKVHV